MQNYPNPFNPSTKISFVLPSVRRSATSPYNTILTVYDVLGREIDILLNQPMQPGEYEVTFNAVHLPSGVYYYRLSIGEFSSTKKMVLIR